MKRKAHRVQPEEVFRRQRQKRLFHVVELPSRSTLGQSRNPEALRQGSLLASVEVRARRQDLLLAGKALAKAMQAAQPWLPQTS